MSERVFLLPDLGEGLEEAVVTVWLVAVGETVELNQPFAEIETAKATVEIPSPFAGRIAKLHAEAGATLAVGAPLVTFEVEVSETTGSPPFVATATPAVRRLAKDRGIDISSVAGTGPEGRVIREDVERASSNPTDGDSEVVPLTPVRRAIARNLEDIARIPQVTTFRTVDCTELDALRRELDVSPLPVFVRALAEICHEHPWINASWSDDGIRLHRLVHVGVATDTDRGLVVPVLRDAGSQAIGAIAAEIARLAGSARTNTLTPQDMSGATIAVTNTGSYGSEAGTPLLHLGHAVTIALGVIAPRALVIDGSVEARPACTLSLTFDHRVLDGATVGRAFGSLVDLLESRERLGTLPR
jgi:2-oxoisovalerate dehydrogenase E2 component (dihydrolipoyl transacylase)